MGRLAPFLSHLRYSDDSDDWESDENSEAITEELEGVTSSPLYMIKKLGKIGSNLTITGYGDDNTAPTVFRVTVRGTGGTNNRATLLRSHYSKMF